MADYLNSGILALIQGATEFLPISSSAHLIVIPHLFSWRDQGLAFDIAVHLGTLIASVSYFRLEIIRILRGWIQSFTGEGPTDESKLCWFIIVASIPVAIAGALAHEIVEKELRSVEVIAIATLAFGVLLWYADWFRRGERQLNTLRFRDAILIGLGQAVAIIPGTSRSGITITVALMLGLTRQDAAKFAFLLAIPVIAMAGGWQILSLTTSNQETNWLLFGYATAISAVVAYLCIHYFLRFIEKIGMLPFVIYRVVLALTIFTLM